MLHFVSFPEKSLQTPHNLLPQGGIVDFGIWIDGNLMAVGFDEVVGKMYLFTQVRKPRAARL